jgi:hypothetical protein
MASTYIFSAQLTDMSKSTPATAKPSPLSFVIMTIIADHAWGLQALAVTSAGSLHHATLCTSYENAINLAGTLHCHENLTDRFTTLLTEIKDLALK